MSTQPDGHIVVTRDDVADENPKALAKRFDFLASEVRQLAEDIRELPRLVSDRVERVLDQFVARLDEHSRRIAVLEEHRDGHHARLSKLEALAAAKPRTRTRKKR